MGVKEEPHGLLIPAAVTGKIFAEGFLVPRLLVSLTSRAYILVSGVSKEKNATVP